jgi:hypothetical protein
VDRREDGDHRLVDPDVDRTPGALDLLGGTLCRPGVGDVSRHHQRLAAPAADLAGGMLQRQPVAGQQSNSIALFGEGPGDGAADPAQGPGYQDGTRLHPHGHLTISALQRGKVMCLE